MFSKLIEWWKNCKSNSRKKFLQRGRHPRKHQSLCFVIAFKSLSPRSQRGWNLFRHEAIRVNYFGASIVRQPRMRENRRKQSIELGSVRLKLNLSAGDMGLVDLHTKHPCEWLWDSIWRVFSPRASSGTPRDLSDVSEILRWRHLPATSMANTPDAFNHFPTVFHKAKLRVALLLASNSYKSNCRTFMCVCVCLRSNYFTKSKSILCIQIGKRLRSLHSCVKFHLHRRNFPERASNWMGISC